MPIKRYRRYIFLIGVFALIQFLILYYAFNQSKKQTISIKVNKKCSEETDKSNKYDYIKRYPFVLNCNKRNEDNILIKSFLKHQYEEGKYDFSLPANEITHTKRITRAVLVYFPIESFDNYYLEFKWFYRSWIEMQKYESNYWRTDLIVFTNMLIANEKANKYFQELNCLLEHQRKSEREKPHCKLVQYVSIKNRTELNYTTKGDIKPYEFFLDGFNIFDDNLKNLSIFHYFLKESFANYNYIDSILMAFDGYTYFKDAGYDYLIRSDIDVFLTPLFGQWLPRYCNDFYVGRGGYSTSFNKKRLNRIAESLNLKYSNMMNLGSTWYSYLLIL